jgi:hypothetical protein
VHSFRPAALARRSALLNHHHRGITGTTALKMTGYFCKNVLKEGQDVIYAMDEGVKKAKSLARDKIEEICARSSPKDAFEMRLQYLESAQGCDPDDGWGICEEPEIGYGTITYTLLSDNGFDFNGKSYLESDSRYGVSVGYLKQQDKDVFTLEIRLFNFGYADNEEDDH